MLTKRERVLASIRRSPLDALPWHFDMTGAVSDKVAAYYGTDDLLAATDDHLVWVGPVNPPGFLSESTETDMYTDEFGTKWHRNAKDRNVGDWGGLVSVPLSEPTLKGYRFPDGAVPCRWNHVPEFRKKFSDHFLVTAGFGLFEHGWALCGFENYLSYIGNEPQFIEELTEKLADHSCAFASQLRAWV
jgi:hypothetical protein